MLRVLRLFRVLRLLKVLQMRKRKLAGMDTVGAGDVSQGLGRGGGAGRQLGNAHLPQSWGRVPHLCPQ